MAECPDADHLADLAAGQLPAQQAEALHGHLRGCEGCRRALAALAVDLSPASPTLELTTPTASADALRPQDRVGRFELLAPLGAGSMGAVWAARDPELGRQVALKTVKAAAPDPAALARLTREAQAMAALAHPNVVTVYEVVAHQDRVFLAMELVPGGTLGDWLRRGPHPFDAVLEAFLGAGRGLAAAHAAGLVHRDFKPDNVLMGADGRVRVTDFGLARAAGDGASEPTTLAGDALLVTRTGALVGTPAYMAPEQLRGEPIDQRADVFAFCVALWEAVYGARPFAAPTLSALRQRVEAGTPAQGPRHGPAWLRRVLLRGLSPQAAARPPSMDALLASLLEARAAAGRRRALAWASLAVGLVVAAGLAGWTHAHPAAPAPSSAVGPRRAVAVLPPRATQASEGWRAAALADMLGAELSASEALRLVPARLVAPLAAKLDRPDELDAPALASLRDALGADLVLTGAYLVDGGGLRLGLRLHDAAGRVVLTVAEQGEVADLSGAVARAGTKLRRGLGLPEPGRGAEPTASYPHDAEVQRLFARGLEQLHAKPRAAVELLEAAAARAPAEPRVLAAQAEAYGELGDLARASAAAAAALGVAGHLGREDRLRLERLAAQPYGQDPTRAVEVSHALWTFFPDDVEYGLALAEDLELANRLDDAFAVVAQLRRLPPPVDGDPRIDWTEAYLAVSAGQYQRAVDLSQRAAEAAERRGATRVQAAALQTQGNALRKLGRPAEAARAFDAAERLSREAGDLRRAAIASMSAGFIAADAGDLAGARARIEAAVALSHEYGNAYGEASATHNLANVLYLARDYQAAAAAADRAVELSLQIHQPVRAAGALETKGAILSDAGQLAEALAATERALALRREQKDSEVALALFQLGELLRQRGQPALARQRCEEARAAAGEERLFLAVAAFCLGKLELDAGHGGEAARLAGEASGHFEALGRTVEVAAARALRATALLASGRLAEAQAEVDQATAAAGATQSPAAGAVLAVARARVDAARPGGLPRAVAALRQAVTDAERTGTAEDRLEARVLLATLEARAGGEGGRRALRDVTAEARAAGFERLAQRATQALAEGR